MLKQLNITNSTIDLHKKIEELKSELIEVGLAIGLNHPTTIKLSQKLDKVIIEFQRLSNHIK